jgi:hypothetical protein
MNTLIAFLCFPLWVALSPFYALVGLLFQLTSFTSKDDLE